MENLCACSHNYLQFPEDRPINAQTLKYYQIENLAAFFSFFPSPFKTNKL